MGSWLSSALHAVGGWVAGDGNAPGTAETRSIGYDSANVAQAAAAYLSQPAQPNVQQELVMMGIAGVGLILLLSPKRR
jgi:hypothetical protein